MPRRKPKQQGPALIGYARVSTPEQSLEMQIAALERYGVPRGAIHVEKVSGIAASRPVLDSLLAHLREGDNLVMWRLDRMGRSTMDLLQKLDRIRQSGAKFVSLTEAFDSSTLMGQAFLQLTMVLAEFERNLIVERTRAGVKAAMARGVRFGQPPKLTDEQMAKAQKLRDKGWSLARIADEFDVAPGTIRNWTAGPGRTRRRPKR